MINPELLDCLNRSEILNLWNTEIYLEPDRETLDKIHEEKGIMTFSSVPSDSSAIIAYDEICNLIAFCTANIDGDLAIRFNLSKIKTTLIILNNRSFGVIINKC